MLLAWTFPIGTAHAATTITAYKSQIAVNIKGPYQASQWSDTPMISEPTSGITFAVKQNGTGWLFLMIWQQSPGICTDTACYGGIELGHLNNTAVMGSPTTPTIMILASQLFQGMVGHTVDEFISIGEQTPTSVESDGYTTQSVCGALTLTGTTYTVQCYRPFKLTNASPYDFPTLGVGSTIEIGFAVGEFSNPGDHAATTMSDYVLTFSGSTYSSSSTSTTSSSSSSSSSTSTSTSSKTSSSSSSSSTTRTSISTTATTKPAYNVTVATNSKTYAGTALGTISGTVAGPPSAGGTVELQITNPSNVAVFTEVVPVSATGSFNGTFTPGTSWTVTGTYTLTATYSPDIHALYLSYFTATSQFSYTSLAVTTTSSTTTTTSITPSSSLPSYYAEELLVIVVGFSLIVALVFRRYKRS